MHCDVKVHAVVWLCYDVPAVSCACDGAVPVCLSIFCEVCSYFLRYFGF